jgi:hypothetical protein
MLDALGILPDKDASAPPAKRPFPWEKDKKSSQNEQEYKKKPIKSTDKPLKQLLKMIR